MRGKTFIKQRKEDLVALSCPTYQFTAAQMSRNLHRQQNGCFSKIENPKMFEENRHGRHCTVPALTKTFDALIPRRRSCLTSGSSIMLPSTSLRALSPRLAVCRKQEHGEMLNLNTPSLPHRRLTPLDACSFSDDKGVMRRAFLAPVSVRVALRLRN